MQMCALNKIRNDTWLRITWGGNMRIVSPRRPNSCMRWYFTVNGEECLDPGEWMSHVCHMHVTCMGICFPRQQATGDCRMFCNCMVLKCTKLIVEVTSLYANSLPIMMLILLTMHDHNTVYTPHNPNLNVPTKTLLSRYCQILVLSNILKLSENLYLPSIFIC